jgi:hypothetical protein
MKTLALLLVVCAAGLASSAKIVSIETKTSDDWTSGNAIKSMLNYFCSQPCLRPGMTFASVSIHIYDQVFNDCHVKELDGQGRKSENLNTSLRIRIIS